jgi:hypothetical protein
MNRSAKQFARRHRGGIRTTWMPTSDRTASNDAVNWPARSRTKNRKLGDVIAEIHHEVADLLGGPSPVRVGGRVQQVHRSVRHLAVGPEPEVSATAAGRGEWWTLPRDGQS